MKSRTKTIINILFIAYILFMLWLLFGQRMAYVSFDNYAKQLRTNINLIPFKTALMYFGQIFIGNNGIAPSHAVINFFGNIIMFIPLGVFLPFYTSEKGVLRFILYIIAIISAVEIIQLFTLLGSCDIDDLILNTIGALIGYPFHKILKK